MLVFEDRLRNRAESRDNEIIDTWMIKDGKWYFVKGRYRKNNDEYERYALERIKKQLRENGGKYFKMHGDDEELDLNGEFKSFDLKKLNFTNFGVKDPQEIWDIYYKRADGNINTWRILEMDKETLEKAKEVYFKVNKEFINPDDIKLIQKRIDKHEFLGFGTYYAGDPGLDLDSPLSLCFEWNIGELIDYLRRTGWCYRAGFIYKNLVFINQVNGYEEWAVFRKEIEDNKITFKQIESITGSFVSEEEWLRMILKMRFRREEYA